MHRGGCSEAVGTQVKLVNTGRAGETCPGWQGITRLRFCNNVSTRSRAAMLVRIRAEGFRSQTAKVCVNVGKAASPL